MFRIIPAAVCLMALASAPASAQPFWPLPPRPPLPPPFVQVTTLNGDWYMNGDPNKPTHIGHRRGDDQALFMNENGSQAWGSIRGNTVWIPHWTDGLNLGLEGVIRGERIVWPNGTYWSRRPNWVPWGY